MQYYSIFTQCIYPTRNMVHNVKQCYNFSQWLGNLMIKCFVFENKLTNSSSFIFEWKPIFIFTLFCMKQGELIDLEPRKVNAVSEKTIISQEITLSQQFNMVILFIFKRFFGESTFSALNKFHCCWWLLMSSNCWSYSFWVAWKPLCTSWWGLLISIALV